VSEDGSHYLTYDQFFNVIRRWDAYMHLEFSEMPRSFPVTDSMDDLLSSGRHTPGYGTAVSINLSDLAEIMWKTLKAGPEKVDYIHDESFIEIQVKHFKQCFASPEQVAANFKDTWGETLPPPSEMFFRLGKPAQMALIREDLLEEAIDIYAQGEEIHRNKEQAKIIESGRRRDQEKEIIATRKRARELDKSQCAFCGKHVVKNFRYAQLAPGSYKPDNVVVVCTGCNSKLKDTTAQETGMSPRFGRFSEREVANDSKRFELR
jgi:hypothetical protein